MISFVLCLHNRTFALLNYKMMNQEEKDILFKARSYRSVLAAGIRLYTSNFRKFFKASWLTALLYSLVDGAASTLMTLKIPAIFVAIMLQIQKYHGIFIEPLLHYAWTIFAIMWFFIAAFAVMALAHGTIMNQLKEHQETGSISIPTSWFKPSVKLMGRTLKGLFFTGFIFIGYYILEIALLAALEAIKPGIIMQAPFTVFGCITIVNTLMSLLALPLFYVLPKYVLNNDKGYWSTLASSYGCGIRHWGSLFLVFFVSILLIAIVGLVIILPANILYIANYMAQMGQLYGDPLGMPSYMTPMTYITYVLCNFIEFYALLLLLLHSYYAYGSIEAKEQERKQQKLDILS